jgi:hypothetical protein
MISDKLKELPNYRETKCCSNCKHNRFARMIGRIYCNKLANKVKINTEEVETIVVRREDICDLYEEDSE